MAGNECSPIAPYHGCGFEGFIDRWLLKGRKGIEIRFRHSAEVKNLKQSFSDAKGRIKLSMKERRVCPLCSGRRIAYFAAVPDLAYGPTENRGLVVTDRGRWRTDGTDAALECFACTACGYVESYVADTSFFAKHPDRYELLESEAPSNNGPFR